MATVPAAYPFVEVSIKPPPPPIVRRAPGVLAIVGKTKAGADGGTASANVPLEIVTLDDAAKSFAKVDNNGTVTSTALYSSIEIAFQQDPRPTKIYGVRVAGDNYAAALASLEGVDDITFVTLANEADIGAASAGNPPTGLHALQAHVKRMAADGRYRLGVAMVDPAKAKSDDYISEVTSSYEPLKHGYMVLIAARGAVGDVATAAASAIAGLPPQTSIVLKKIRGLSIANEQRYSPREIIQLSDANIVPIINPVLISGDSLHFAEGRLFTSDADILFVDDRRLIDHIRFLLEAGLVGLVGDARITKAGLTLLKAQISAILDPLVSSAALDRYSVDIPILNILQIPEASRTTAENSLVTEARNNRVVDAYATIWIGPAFHRLHIDVLVKR